ncbi:helix-turn-helix domain-containing protein [Streptomonospora wellingtoniae]|uniref:Helix-turn-helix domain-containing protein n=1 Tax=Streptomonospora wellingtoniae TaxID=3075544 RepID=A0ABU2L105_9ACTN|nr:helix-turn-helix domain-containing protein [Streptomonospora sp. DSM 45055]MDT0305096.1 helix-turn-helix domain-containing protein [Streptomonospora sp. DSM 45055]
MPHSERSGTTLHTIPATARLLGCHRSHVYRLIARGELRVTDIKSPTSTRTKTRVPDSSIQEYSDRHARTAVTA